MNQSTDIEFISYCVSQIVIWLSAYFLFYTPYIKALDFNKLLKCIIYTILIQSILAVLISTTPTFKDVMFKIINISNLDILEEQSQGRFIGWGIAFFNAGALNGLALLLITHLIITNKSWNTFITAIIFSIILLSGIFLARTVLVSFGLCLFYILANWGKVIFKVKLIHFILYLTTLISLLVILAFTLLDEQILNWAFELFLNYLESENMESESTNRLLEMYILPSSIFTYIWGDGQFTDPQGGYYMHTDVGYLRLLFYFGVGGLLSFFIFQWKLIKSIIKLKQSNHSFLFTLFGYTLILNFKGLIDFNFILYLLYFSLQQKKTLYDT